MRQRMSEKRVAQMRQVLGLPIVKVLVRGGTQHRKDLCLEDGSITYLYPDGTVVKTETTWARE